MLNGYINGANIISYFLRELLNPLLVQDFNLLERVHLQVSLQLW
jgi:hypothetical protein